MPREKSGFTVIEVMVALAVLAVGMLALLLMQAQTVRDGSRGKHSTTAAMIARDQLELIQRMPYSDADLSPIVWTTPPWLANGANPALNPGEVPTRVRNAGGTVTEQVYTVFYRVLVDPGGNADLRSVDLEVAWNEAGISNNRPTRTGLPTVALSTLVVNNDR